MKKNKNRKHTQTTDAARLVLPPKMLQFTATVREYLQTLPEETRALLELGTQRDIVEHSGAMERVSYLLSAFYHIHSIQSLLQADIEILMDKWGLWLKGVRPAMTSLQQADDKFYRTMRDVFSGKDADTDNWYNQDVDSLSKKFFRWEGIPVTWSPGQPQRINFTKAGEDATPETLLIETAREWARIGAIDAPDPVNKASYYCVGKMLDDETVQMGNKDYDKLSTARSVAAKFANSEKGAVFIIYKRTATRRYVPTEFKRTPKDDE